METAFRQHQEDQRLLLGLPIQPAHLGAQGPLYHALSVPNHQHRIQREEQQAQAAAAQTERLPHHAACPS